MHKAILNSKECTQLSNMVWDANVVTLQKAGTLSVLTDVGI